MATHAAQERRKIYIKSFQKADKGDFSMLIEFMKETKEKPFRDFSSLLRSPLYTKKNTQSLENPVLN